MPKELTKEQALEHALARGFRPLEPYKGLREPWRCIRMECGHEVTAKYEYIRQGNTGCSVCNGKTVLPGFNDLASKFPEVADQADGWDPTAVTAKSGKKMPWKCSAGHQWIATVASRSDGRGCPFCRGQIFQPGVNDLATGFPEIAAEADGWDPSTVHRGTQTKYRWKCLKGHTWMASVVKRTASNRGCPICSNNKVLSGYNDLATKFPNVAAEADGWDPSLVAPSSHKKLAWKCAKGHRWIAKVGSRTLGGNGCSVCRNLTTVPGVNDLASQHPRIAAQADGWDPSTVNAGSNLRMMWRCSRSHTWETTVAARVARNSGCPTCSGKDVAPGFNDLATTHPEIAEMAHGWDPTSVIAGSHQIKEWMCQNGHITKAKVQTRARGVGCPYCSNLWVLPGFNDLATTHPDVASEADGWDPSEVIAGTHSKYNWLCSAGHRWAASPNKRAISGRGCPICAKTGFNPGISGWFYFLEHPDWEMLQIGITNQPKDRLRTHELNGWAVLEVRGPMEGDVTQALERAALKTLKARGAIFAKQAGLAKFDGFTEAWTKSSLKVSAIKEIIEWVHQDEALTRGD